MKMDKKNYLECGLKVYILWIEDLPHPPPTHLMENSATCNLSRFLMQLSNFKLGLKFQFVSLVLYFV